MENNVIGENTERKEFTLKECFVLWKHTNEETHERYLTGYTSIDGKPQVKLRGVYVTEKTNEKAPDIRIFTAEDNKDYASLWINESEKGMYLTGQDINKNRLVGFYTKEVINNRPDIKVYYSEDK